MFRTCFYLFLSFEFTVFVRAMTELLVDRLVALNERFSFDRHTCIVPTVRSM